MKRVRRFIYIVLSAILLSSCSAPSSSPNSAARLSYRQISMDKAVLIMREEHNYIILDVRRPNEYAAGHIPGAINIPNEEIGAAQISELPDKAQLILVYCRSGRRSKEASEKLANLGYTNVVEFGGILDWKGEIEK